MNKRTFGGQAEDVACRFLEARGLRVLQRNFRTRYGEIDLIARDGEFLVFIEVKCRTNPEFGAPEEAVGRTKQRQIVKMANSYLRGRECACRFDVVAITLRGGVAPVWQVRLIRDAFRAER